MSPVTSRWTNSSYQRTNSLPRSISSRGSPSFRTPLPTFEIVSPHDTVVSDAPWPMTEKQPHVDPQTGVLASPPAARVETPEPSHDGNRDTILSGLRQHPVTRGFGRESWRESWRSWRASKTYARGQQQKQKQQQQEQQQQQWPPENKAQAQARGVDDERVVSDPLPRPRLNSEFLAPSHPSYFSLDGSVAGTSSATHSWYGAGLAPAPSNACKPPVSPVQEVDGARASSAEGRLEIMGQAAGPRSPVLVQPGTTGNGNGNGAAGDRSSMAGVVETGSPSQGRSDASVEGTENKQGSGKSSRESLVEVSDLRPERASRFSEGNTLSSTSFSWDGRAGEHLDTTADPGFGLSAVSQNPPQPARHSAGPG